MNRWPREWLRMHLNRGSPTIGPKCELMDTIEYPKKLGARDIEVKVAGSYSLYFFADHAAKEVKIVDCLRSDPT